MLLYPPKKPQKSKMKNFAGDIIILQMCTKNHNYVWFLRYRVRQVEFLAILGHFFAILTPHPPSSNDPENQNFEKKK